MNEGMRKELNVFHLIRKIIQCRNKWINHTHQMAKEGYSRKAFIYKPNSMRDRRRSRFLSLDKWGLSRHPCLILDLLIMVMNSYRNSENLYIKWSDNTYLKQEWNRRISQKFSLLRTIKFTDIFQTVFGQFVPFHT